MSFFSRKKKLRCGVAGVGYLGQHHARIYKELPNCELAGIYEVDDQRANEICQAYGCPRFETLEELGAACDAVSVVVPTDKHCDIAVPLLEQGTHLLIEKPLCQSLEEAETIVATAKDNNCIVQVGHIEHFNPTMGFLEKAVVDPRFITADRLAPFNPRGTEVGVVLDLMIHDIGIIMQLVRSKVVDIQAVGVNVVSKTEDIANARLTFENGCVANINTSRISNKKLREIRVFQPFTYLSLDFMNQKGHYLKKKTLGLEKKEVPIQKGEPLMLELKSFTECVLSAGKPKVGIDLGFGALEVALQVTEIIQEQIRKAGM